MAVLPVLEMTGRYWARGSHKVWQGTPCVVDPSPDPQDKSLVDQADGSQGLKYKGFWCEGPMRA